MNATEFCKLVEARLGWEAPAGSPRMRYRAEAAKVNRKIQTNPHLYTWDNLQLAVALLVREKKSRTPIGVFAHVERALTVATEQEVDVEEQIRAIVAYETSLGDPMGWVVRFSRAVGHYRVLAVEEWKAAVR